LGHLLYVLKAIINFELRKEMIPAACRFIPVRCFLVVGRRPDNYTETLLDSFFAVLDTYYLAEAPSHVE
jgi:hypothetical protein